MTILEWEKSKDVSVCFPLDNNFNIVIAYNKYGIDYNIHHKSGDNVHAVATDYDGNIIISKDSKGNDMDSEHF